MGRLTAAVRTAKVRLGKSASDTKKLRKRMQPDRLKDTHAFLMSELRRLPASADLLDILDQVEANWDPKDADKPAPGKSGQTPARDDDAGDKKALLREVLAALKRTRKFAGQVVAEAQRDAALAALAAPAQALVRAKRPKEREPAHEVAELLTLMTLLAELTERYARRLRA